MSKPKSIILLQALLDGHVIEKAGERFKLLSNNCLAKSMIRNMTEEVWIAINFGDVTIASFIDWSNSFDDKAITIISANAALNSVKKEDRRERNELEQIT